MCLQCFQQIISTLDFNYNLDKPLLCTHGDWILPNLYSTNLAYLHSTRHATSTHIEPNHFQLGQSSKLPKWKTFLKNFIAHYIVQATTFELEKSQNSIKSSNLYHPYQSKDLIQHGRILSKYELCCINPEKISLDHQHLTCTGFEFNCKFNL